MEGRLGGWAVGRLSWGQERGEWEEMAMVVRARDEENRGEGNTIV